MCLLFCDVQIHSTHCVSTCCLLCCPGDPIQCPIRHFHNLYHLTPFAPLALLSTSCCSGSESPYFYFQLPSLPPFCCLCYFCPAFYLLLLLPHFSLTHEKAGLLEVLCATHRGAGTAHLNIFRSCNSCSFLSAMGLLLYYQTCFGGFFWLRLHSKIPKFQTTELQIRKNLVYHHMKPSSSYTI